nr:PepSY domain-containing protein [Streptomyces sp. CC219B]
MAWKEAPSLPGSSVVNVVGWTTKCLAKVLASSISWRIGPHCIVITGSIWSARYGVADRPTQRLAIAPRIAASAPGAPTLWHSSTMTRPYPSSRSAGASRCDRVCSMIRSTTWPRRSLPPPSEPTWWSPRSRNASRRCFHWSSSSLRLTTTAVGVRWWAISAQAMTVLPEGSLPEGLTVDRILDKARAAGLDGPVEISTPADDKSAWTVAQTDGLWPVHKDQAAIDPHSGEVTSRVDWADHPVLAKLSTLGVAAHMGTLFGLANQIVLAVIALGLTTGIVLGYRMWWQRRPTRADRRALVGRPPARGTWRKLPWPALAVAVPLTIAVGWAIPLLGWSLLAFLVLDGVLGLIHRQRATRSAAGA